MAWLSRRRLATWEDELLPVQGGAEGTEECVLALHTEVREKCEVTSCEEGHALRRGLRKHDANSNVV